MPSIYPPLKSTIKAVCQPLHCSHLATLSTNMDICAVCGMAMASGRPLDGGILQLLRRQEGRNHRLCACPQRAPQLCVMRRLCGLCEVDVRPVLPTCAHPRTHAPTQPWPCKFHNDYMRHDYIATTTQQNACGRRHGKGGRHRPQRMESVVAGGWGQAKEGGEGGRHMQVASTPADINAQLTSTP